MPTAYGHEIVTICGSMRFFSLMLEVAASETLQGKIVLSPFSIVEGSEQDGEAKRRLDELHLRKIDMAERVLVVSDHTGYYGVSTRREIAYAEANNKPVSFVYIYDEGDQGRQA